ncbi:DNA metabolism protein [Sphingobacteriaceae bacterium]|nr:DNA metabolism protein [Sphingobacteriaceae bacterium]
MTQYSYDGSFAGLLTCIFEIYDRKSSDPDIVRSGMTDALIFSETMEVVTDEVKAERVWKGLKEKVSEKTLTAIYWAFLSELKGIENSIYLLVKYIFSSNENVESNFGNEYVLLITQIARKVGREKHRFEAFVRFELIGTDFFYSPVDPDFNVLPIIVPHFKSRYPAQDWIIYDTKRKYGIHYDKETEQINEVLIDFSDDKKETSDFVFEPEEKYYKDLWRNYFKSVNIAVRKNTKLHLKHVPKRYWKYLVEKQ